MKRKRHVALLIETATTYGRAILAGIAKYQSSHSPWSTYIDERELRAAPPAWLLQRQWDGIICRATNPQFAKAIQQKAIPAVDLNDLYHDLGLPHIQSDMREIGRVAARHLYERGFRHFAYCGFSKETWSSERLEGFASQLQDFRCTCEVYESAWRGVNAPEWDADQARIAKWLAKLPKPLGVAACNDVRGQHVLNACMSSDIVVPEQIAVIGVDNNELLCNFCNPPLSSVLPDAEAIGHEAARWLDALMDGRQTPRQMLVAPLGVVTRHSTDALGIEDETVVAAIAYIRDTACHGVTMRQLVEHLGVSRSVIERRFRKWLGHSPQQEIRFTQLRRVKELLRDTDLTLSKIAALTGFEHTEYLTVVFKRITGEPPSAFRNRIRRREGSP